MKEISTIALLVSNILMCVFMITFFDLLNVGTMFFSIVAIGSLLLINRSFKFGDGPICFIGNDYGTLIMTFSIIFVVSLIVVGSVVRDDGQFYTYLYGIITNIVLATTSHDLESNSDYSSNLQMKRIKRENF